jgi:hypothetical protein
VSPTFIHGKSAVVYQDGNDLTGYLRSVSNSAEVDTAEATTFANDDKTYVAGMADATLSAEGLFDSTFDGDLNTITGSGTKSIWSVYPGGDSVGLPGRGYSLDITSAERSADIGDVVMISLEGQSSVGTDAVVSHHALAARSTSGTAGVVDAAASSANGGVGYLHVTQISGTAVITLQDSSDNSTFADYLSLGTVTSTGAVRAVGLGTVNRYTRLTYTITGGTATFVAGFSRS